MLELGNPKTPRPAGDLIKDGTEATFMADVIEGSRETPVIVDFWATWCGPCKTLGPMLEAAVTAAKGKVRMVKIDVDANSASPRWRSRAAASVDPDGRRLLRRSARRHVPGRDPAGPDHRVRQQAVPPMAGDGGLGEAVEAAEQMLAEGAVTDAAQTFAAILGEDPENAAALWPGWRARISRWTARPGRGASEQRAGEDRQAPELEAVRAQIALARQAENAGPLADCPPRWRPTRRTIRRAIDYAQALHASGQVEEAVEQLLELFRRDREWNDGAAKTQLFTIFDALKPTDPIVQKGRRRLELDDICLRPSRRLGRVS
jgi:putative thioredoxin